MYEECVSKLDRIFSIRDSDYCSRSAKHLYQILVPNVGGDSISSRDLLLNDFYEENIYPGVHYTDNTEYPMYSKSRGLCPKSHRISEELISLPLHLNMTDMETGYKLFKKKAIDSITLKENSFSIEPEITVKLAKKGYIFYEVPISYRGRSYQEGKKITLKDAFIAIYCIIKYKFFD